MAKLPALPYVRSGVSEGLSANASYRQYQSLARQNDLQGMRRQDYLRLYSETRMLRGQAAEAVSAPRDVPGGGLKVNPRTTEYATGYGHWVGIYQRTRGTSDQIKMPYLIKSTHPLTPEEAEAKAREYLDTHPDEYDRVTLGVTFLGFEQYTPRNK